MMIKRRRFLLILLAFFAVVDCAFGMNLRKREEDGSSNHEKVSVYKAMCDTLHCVPNGFDDTPNASKASTPEMRGAIQKRRTCLDAIYKFLHDNSDKKEVRFLNQRGELVETIVVDKDGVDEVFQELCERGRAASGSYKGIVASRDARWIITYVGRGYRKLGVLLGVAGVVILWKDPSSLWAFLKTCFHDFTIINVGGLCLLTRTPQFEFGMPRVLEIVTDNVVQPVVQQLGSVAKFCKWFFCGDGEEYKDDDLDYTFDPDKQDGPCEYYE